MEAGSERYSANVLVGDSQARQRTSFWSEPLHRYSVLERTLHWVMASSGIVCVLTGLGWYTRGFQFLLTWFGGGEWARWIHSVSGIVMVICTIWLIAILWARRMFRFIAEDRHWLKVMGGYLQRQGHAVGGSGSKRRVPELGKEVPPQGFFNVGQKLWGILAVILAVAFLGSGLAIWSPELFHDFLGMQPFSVPVMRAMYVIHDAAFIVMAPMIVLHIYLSTTLNPGTFSSMTKGVVTRLWAHHHHRLWYDEVAGGKEASEE